jgi:plasmid stabilization system protein ParE
MTVRTLKAARTEFEQAVDWYANQSEELADRFRTAVADAIAAVLDRPARWPCIDGEVRRYTVKTFPYGIFYRARTDEVVILAIMHMRRDPERWKKRLK